MTPAAIRRTPARGALACLLLACAAPGCRPSSAAAEATPMPEYPPAVLVQRAAPAPVSKPAELKARTLTGIVIKIIYVHRRTHDANTAAARLRDLGARIELFETSESGNEPHTGKVYYYKGYEPKAEAIAQVIAGIEEVAPASAEGSSPDLGQHINLWIVQ